ncbi:MAG: tRNA (adenosine(37)-N6)-threonylcarbamoyltransferase complex dimerization subunit type 1 TsaB [Candidatus Limnocylindrales bacterium]
MSGRSLILALDTATRTPTLALVGGDGDVVGERQWRSEHRHGEQLLQRLDELLSAANATPSDLTGIIVGVGPGSFTGLRIGLATVKTIAYTLEIPVVGVSTTQALALAAVWGDGVRREVAVTLPAGAADRYVDRMVIEDGSVLDPEPAQLVAGEAAFAEAVGDAELIAVDVEGADDISDDAIERGQAALAGLGRALALLGTKALAAGRSGDVARLVPAYVALPRGITQAAAEMTWSPDLR